MTLVGGEGEGEGGDRVKTRLISAVLLHGLSPETLDPLRLNGSFGSCPPLWDDYAATLLDTVIPGIGDSDGSGNDEEASCNRNVASIDTTNLALFSLPFGVRLRRIVNNNDTDNDMAPKVHTFVLTDKLGCRFFAASLVYHERIDHEIYEALCTLEFCYNQNYSGQSPVPPRLSVHGEGQLLAPKALTIISRYPFLPTFKNMLAEWQDLVVPHLNHGSTLTSPQQLKPLRKIPQRVRDLVHRVTVYDASDNGGENIVMPESTIAQNLAPRWNRDFMTCPIGMLLDLLSVEHMMTLLTCLLAEGRVVLISEDAALLQPLGDALLQMLLPFAWLDIYVPWLPQLLSHMADAPLPFIIGLPVDPARRRLSDISAMERDDAFEASRESGPYISVNIDHGIVKERGLNGHSLPEAASKRLKARLERLKTRTGVECDSDDIDGDLQAALMTFFAEILGGLSYERYLTTGSHKSSLATDGTPQYFFNAIDFVANSPAHLQPFLYRFTKTQLFHSLLQRVSTNEDQLASQDPTIAEFRTAVADAVRAGTVAPKRRRSSKVINIVAAGISKSKQQHQQYSLPQQQHHSRRSSNASVGSNISSTGNTICASGIAINAPDCNFTQDSATLTEAVVTLLNINRHQLTVGEVSRMRRRSSVLSSISTTV